MRKFPAPNNLVLLTSLITIILVFITVPVFPAQARDTAEGLFTTKISLSDYARLRAKAQEDGRLRLIVRLDVSYDPQTMALDNADAFQQRHAIDSAQARVAMGLTGLNAEILHNYEFTPFSLLSVDSRALDALLSLPSVASVEEDRIEKADLEQSIPLINADDAWVGGYTGAGQAIAILDTGVDKNHPFLSGKVVSEACYSSNYSGSPASTSICPGGVQESTAVGSALPYGGSCPSGDCDHGTHVAGIAAGRGGSFSGVAKDAVIVAVQVFSRFDDYPAAGCYPTNPCALSWTSDQLKGLERVYELRNAYNIAAINMSIGGSTYAYYCDSDSRKAQIDLLRAAGIVTVISSGNNGSTNSISSPACISSAVSVGATTKSDVVASYSNSASFLNLLAPGSSIQSSLPGNRYAYWSGTSMAAPHVSGAWAVIKSREPNSTVDEVLQILTSSGQPVYDTRNGITKPRVDVLPAVDTVLAELTDFIALSYSQQRIRLSWIDNSVIENGYRVERSPDGSSDWVQIGGDLPPNSIFYEDYPLECGTMQYYRVTVFNDASMRVSGVISQTTWLCGISPSPTGALAAALSNTTIRVEWDDVGDYETGYRVERSPDGLNSWAQVADVEQDKTSFDDRGLEQGSYFYRVTAVNTSGASQPSPAVSASTYPYGSYAPLVMY